MVLTIFLHILMIVEYCSFCYVFFNKSLDKIAKKTYIGGILVFCGIIYAALNVWDSGLKLFLSYILIFVALYSIFNISLLQTTGIGIISILVLAPVECLLLYVLMVLWNFPPVINNILYTLVIILVIWLYYIAIIKKNSDFIKIPAKLKAIIILAIAGIVLMVAFIIYNMLGLSKKFKIMGIPIIAGGVLGVLILLSAIIYYLNDIQKQNMKNIILEQYNKQQGEYYQNMLERETSTKQFRHDIINHLM